MVINTRDPTQFQRLYEEAAAKVMEQGEATFENALDDTLKNANSD